MLKNNKHKENNNYNIRDRIIEIILLIIIVFLLLHNCSLMGKKEAEEDKVNVINIVCNSNKCEQQDIAVVDCLIDDQSSQCLVPNFNGKTKSDLLKWLNSISNNVEIEIKIVESMNYLDGTIMAQSAIGTSVKDLLEGKTKLIITIAKNESLIDKDNPIIKNKETLPDFIGKTTNNFESWFNELDKLFVIRYIYIDSNEPKGTILDQTIEAGTYIDDIVDNDLALTFYISKGEITPVLLDDFYVSDKRIVMWKDEVDLKIFEDSSNISKVSGKIAPESSGTYKFIVNNGTKYNLKYKISFTETNQYNMNIKYKLKKEDTYLIDHYVSYDELNFEDLTLNTNSSDTYYLEWKWIGDNDTLDTDIGTNANSKNISYYLKIDVEAESI
jgi:hypothetical protein